MVLWLLNICINGIKKKIYIFHTTRKIQMFNVLMVLFFIFLSHSKSNIYTQNT